MLPIGSRFTFNNRPLRSKDKREQHLHDIEASSTEPPIERASNEDESSILQPFKDFKDSSKLDSIDFNRKSEKTFNVHRLRKLMFGKKSALNKLDSSKESLRAKHMNQQDLSSSKGNRAESDIFNSIRTVGDLKNEMEYCGYMALETQGMLFKSWTSHFFILSSNHILYYFKSNLNTEHQIGTIPITIDCLSFTQMSKKKWVLTIQVTTKDLPTGDFEKTLWRMRCDDGDQLFTWVRMIRKSITRLSDSNASFFCEETLKKENRKSNISILNEINSLRNLLASRNSMVCKNEKYQQMRQSQDIPRRSLTSKFHSLIQRRSTVRASMSNQKPLPDIVQDTSNQILGEDCKQKQKPLLPRKTFARTPRLSMSQAFRDNTAMTGITSALARDSTQKSTISFITPVENIIHTKSLESSIHSTNTKRCAVDQSIIHSLPGRTVRKSSISVQSEISKIPSVKSFGEQETLQLRTSYDESRTPSPLSFIHEDVRRISFDLEPIEHIIGDDFMNMFIDLNMRYSGIEELSTMQTLKAEEKESEYHGQEEKVEVTLEEESSDNIVKIGVVSECDSNRKIIKSVSSSIDRAPNDTILF